MAELGIRNVCVIGAGTMGGGIAAHLANLGFQVTLLDSSQQSVMAGLDRARTSRPPSFYIPERSGDIRLGNTIEHLHYASEADWVCEAIVEREEEKKALFARLDPLLRDTALITTNTSGLQISRLSEGRSDAFRRRFFGAHFFNPPRYLRLLELIPTPETDKELLKQAVSFFEKDVARRVVQAKDTPGFIANRYGMWTMFHATRVAEKLRLSIEDVDAITGKFMGRPKSGTFRLNDMVGLDVMQDIGKNLLERCSGDPMIHELEATPSMFALVARGWLGDKTGHGYYRKEGRELLTLDLSTYAYRMCQESKLSTLTELGGLPLAERLKQALERRDEVGEFLREFLIPALRYADSLKAEISHSVLEFDQILMWGFGWEMGPFAMIDAIGAERVGIQEKEPFYRGGSYRDFTGTYHKVKSEGEYRTLQEYPEVGRGAGYLLRDLGDGVMALSLTTKVGVINPPLIAELTELLSHKLDRFVLTSEARSFSAGFDLHFFADAIERADFAGIESALHSLQKLGELLEKKSCVAAIHGYCLGAGLELALSCSQIYADAETQIGLPETKVGLIPGGRGVTLMRMLNSHSSKRLCEVTVTIAEGVIAGNADLARQLGYLRSSDVTVYNRDLLISHAKHAALSVKPAEQHSWSPAIGPLVGMIDQAVGALRSSGAFSEYDEIVAGRIRQIVARSTGYEDALERERTEFVDLCGRNLSQARIKHMLATNHPLRN